MCELCEFSTSACYHKDKGVNICSLPLVKDCQYRGESDSSILLNSTVGRKGKCRVVDNAPKIEISKNCVSTSLSTSVDSCSINTALELGLPDKGLNIGHLNVQGMCGKDLCKFSEIKAILTVNKHLHIMGLSETKLKGHKLSKLFHVEGYQPPFRKDNLSNGGGGIMVYVRNNIIAKRREDLEINDISCVWLEITQGKGKSFLIGNLYRPPDSRVEYNDRFEGLIENASQEGKEIILLGDFNKNLLADKMDMDWQNLTLSLGLSQMVSEPTRVTPDSQTLIDHIYTSSEETISSVKVRKLTLSDHYAIFGNRKIYSFIRKHSHQTITYRSVKNFDETAFVRDLIHVPWEILDTFDDVNDCVQIWNELFLEVVDRHAPLKQHRVRKNHQPDWLTPEILDTMKERNKYKINGNQTEYISLRNKVSSLIRSAKNNMYKTKMEEGKDDPRTIWKIFRDLGASSKTKLKDPLLGINDNGQTISDDSGIANVFNKYFVNIASQLKEPAEYSDFENIKEFVNSKVPYDTFFSIPEISFSFVRNFLSKLDITKATGLDCIGPRLLKIAPDVLCSSITLIVNKSIKSGIFPKVWKEAKVYPIFKSGHKDEVNNYRPISILPTLSKIIEKWIHTKLMTFLNNFNLLHKNQSGFRGGHSTESALILMIDSWLKAINDGKLVGCLMIDFRKAFDLVDHGILLQKLKLYKCDERTITWFDSYLTSRTQTVSINNAMSGSESILYGVPQGSILGPLMFLLFINDLPQVLQNSVSSTDLYADDTTIYDIQSNIKSLETNLQNALILLTKWCRENGMVLNTEKTKVMLITSRQKRTIMKDKNLLLSYNDVELKLTSNEKVLGVHIEDNLLWNDHFLYISKKLSSYLWLLTQIKTSLSIEDKLLFYNAYIRPHLDYCCAVWGNTTHFNVQKLTRLQRRACKIILGNEYLHLEDARKRLKILSFDESVFLHKAKIMYKVANNTAPSYLTDLFQMRNISSNDTLLNLRSVSNRHFLIPKPKINLFKNSFSYSGAIIWNSIPLEIKNSTSINIFINKCLAWMKDV